MKARSSLTAGAVISAIFGVLIGNFIKNLPEHFALSDIIGIIFTVFGVLCILSGIPTLVFGLTSLSTPVGKINFISALANLVFGVTLIFYHSDIILLAASAYLIVFPLCQIIFTRRGDSRRSAAKALVPKIVIGTLLIAFFPAAAGLANTAFAFILSCVGWAIIGISLLFLIVSLFVLYVRPLYSKKHPKDDSTIYLDDEDFNDKNN